MTIHKCTKEDELSGLAKDLARMHRFVRILIILCAFNLILSVVKSNGVRFEDLFYFLRNVDAETVASILVFVVVCIMEFVGWKVRKPKD